MKPWHALRIDDIKRIQAAGPKDFLPNRLHGEEAIRWPVLLLRQFKGLLILILFVAVALSFLIGDKIDAFTIVIIILINAWLGFIQEWKAEVAIKNLKRMLTPHCHVIREGREQVVSSEQLVPGDHVLLSAGSVVPADLRLITATDLKADESALTGESLAVGKHNEVLPESTVLTERYNMAWMGTHIVNGHAEGLVVATGMETELGRIAELTGGIQEAQTRLQKQLDRLARQLGALALAISMVVVLVGIVSGKDILLMMMTGVSLAVAAVPEGLPAVVTITLALGMSAMARRKVLLRHMQAAETLGAVSVICTDKTGTLTKNEMAVQKIWLASGVASVDAGPNSNGDLMTLLETGLKCSHTRMEQVEGSWEAVGSPTEAALAVAAMKAGLRRPDARSIIKEYAFNSERKRMSVIERVADGLLVHMKGAPEVLLAHSSHLSVNGVTIELTAAWRKEIETACAAMGAQGTRTLALARKHIPVQSGEIAEAEAEDCLTFLGIVGLSDPPREEVPAALVKARQAGIRVILITGDSPDTALAISNQIGLPAERAITGAEIKRMTDDDLLLALKHNILFARAVPEDKFRIVKLLQAQGQLVAMTGDGVNDAPALKQADIGIAMGIRGTDVARGASDAVLLDDNFASIISAVAEGRRQYANIRKFVFFLTSHSIGEVFAVFFSILLGGPLMLRPIQILWINLLTDGVTALALSVEKPEKDIMEKPPRAYDQPLINRRAMLVLALGGLYAGLSTLILFNFYLGQSYVFASTMAFTNIVMTAQMLALSFRNLSGPLSAIGWFSNPWIIMAIASMTLMQVLAVYLPALQKGLHTTSMSAGDWSIILLIMLPLFIVPEIYKWICRNNDRNEGIL